MTASSSTPATGAAHHSSVVPSEVGWQFVPQYYTFVNKEPHRLHCFYNKNSTFIHGTEGEEIKPCFGQQVGLYSDRGHSFTVMSWNEADASPTSASLPKSCNEPDYIRGVRICIILVTHLCFEAVVGWKTVDDLHCSGLITSKFFNFSYQPPIFVGNRD